MLVQLIKIQNGIKNVLKTTKNKDKPSIPNAYWMLKKNNQSLS